MTKPKKEAEDLQAFFKMIRGKNFDVINDPVGYIEDLCEKRHKALKRPILKLNETDSEETV